MSSTFLDIFFPPVMLNDDLEFLLGLFCSYRPLTIGTFDDHEPIRNRFDPSNVPAMARRLYNWPVFYWKGAEGIANGVVHTSDGIGQQTASVGIRTSIEQFDRPGDLPEFQKQIVERFGAVYGFIHYLSAQEVAVLAASDTLSEGRGDPMLFINRRNLLRCIPNIYWSNVFGPEYVELFGGRDRVAHAPAPIVREIRPNTFYIQLSDNMKDFGEHHTEMMGVRERIKDYLGRDCFFDSANGFDWSYRVPSLGWKEPTWKPITLESLLKDSEERRRSAGIAKREG